MPPYRAQRGGQFGGGVQRQPAAGLDATGVVDAIMGGANQLVTQAYLRKRAKAEEAVQAEDRRLRLEDRQLAITRQQRLDAIAEEDRKRGREVEDAKLRFEGFVPAQEGATLPIPGYMPIQQAFQTPARIDPRQSPKHQMDQERAAREAAEKRAAEERAHARSLELVDRRNAYQSRRDAQAPKKSASQIASEEEQEQLGLSVIDQQAPNRHVGERFQRAFNAIRKQNPNLSPGIVAYRAAQASGYFTASGTLSAGATPKPVKPVNASPGAALLSDYKEMKAGTAQPGSPAPAPAAAMPDLNDSGGAVPPEYLEAAKADPDYAEYLRSQGVPIP